MTILFALFITGWVVAALIGTQAYFWDSLSRFIPVTSPPSFMRWLSR